MERFSCSVCAVSFMAEPGTTECERHRVESVAEDIAETAMKLDEVLGGHHDPTGPEGEEGPEGVEQASEEFPVAGTAPESPPQRRERPAPRGRPAR